MTAAVSAAAPARLLEALRRRTDEMTDFIAELVRLESPTDDPAAQAPVQELLATALADLGLRVRRIPGRRTGGALLARPRAAGPPFQLLVGHSDTVWPHGTLAAMPVVVEEGTLRGPGAFDAKAGLAAIVFALRAVAELDAEPAVAPVVLVNADEEQGSPESTRTIERLARRAARALVTEPALGLDGRLKTARKGAGVFEVRIGGRGAHGGLEPEAGASAIVELSHVVQALHDLNDPARGVTVNVGLVEGGVRPNVVAPESRAVVDVRIARPEDAPGVERAIRSLRPVTPGTSIRVEGSIDRPPLERTPRNRALWETAREVGRAMGLELEEGLAGGVSDGNTTSLHTATLDGLGAVGDGAHAAHEFVDLARTVERVALLAALVLLPAPAGEATA